MKSLLLLGLFTALCSIANAQDSKTSVGFNFFTSHSDVRYFSDGSFSEDYIDLIDGNETGVVSQAGNVIFKYDINSRFSATWGIGYESIGYQSSTKVEVFQFEGEEFLGMVYRHDYLTLPVSIQFGIIANLYFTVGSSLSAIADVRYKQKMADGKLYRGNFESGAFRDFLFSSSVGLGYSFAMGERWRFYVEPTYSYTWTPFYFSESFDRAPRRIGCSFGFIKRM
jgi:outer membrane protein assembly factor BamA